MDYCTTPCGNSSGSKLTHYEQLASDALAGEIVGSSAGGEQPKFTCYAQTPSGNKHVLVKFTVPQQTAVSQRWGDLLIAESIAAQILRDGGIHAIESTVLVTSNRQVFLEAERFDCKGNDGRLPIVSLEAVQSEFISSPGSWPEAMRRLCEQQLVTHQSVAQTEVIWAFGRLIANSDMHAGNLSFYLSEPPFALTPVYDMLPMAYAPNSAGMLRDAAIEVRFDLNVSKSAWLTAIRWRSSSGKRSPEIRVSARHFATLYQEMPEKSGKSKGKLPAWAGNYRTAPAIHADNSGSSFPVPGSQPAALRTPVAAYPRGTDSPAVARRGLPAARVEAVGKHLGAGDMASFNVEMQFHAAPAKAFIQQMRERRSLTEVPPQLL